MYRIISRADLALDTTCFVVEAPSVAKKALPGQFVIIRIDDRGERIPLTIADFDREKGYVTVVVQAIGKTTKQLCSLSAGDSIMDFAGPLGNPSEMMDNGTVVCIAGGLGIAPVYPIARELKRRGNKVISILGARNESLLFWEDKMRSVSDEVYITTDDGSKGRKGLVTLPLIDILNSGQKVDRVLAIGRPIMMKTVGATTKPFNVKTIASINTIMVDGTGMCGSCRVTVGGKVRFACVDGPEFDAHEVDWDEVMSRQRAYMPEEKMALERHQEAHACRSKT